MTKISKNIVATVPISGLQPFFGIKTDENLERNRSQSGSLSRHFSRMAYEKQ